MENKGTPALCEELKQKWHVDIQPINSLPTAEPPIRGQQEIWNQKKSKQLAKTKQLQGLFLLGALPVDH